MDRRRRAIALACLAVGVAAPWIATSVPTDAFSPADRSLLGLIALQVVLVCVAIGAAAFLPAPIPQTLGCSASPPAGRLGLLRLGLAIAGLLAMSRGLNGLLVELQVRDAGSLREIDGMLRDARRQSTALAVLAIGIGPGIAEELLFRGLVQRTLAARLPVAIAIAGAAVAFALVHFDPLHSAVALALGGYLGVVAWLAGNTWAPMCCHVINNATAATQVLASVPLAAGSGLAGEAAWVGAGAGILLGVAAWTLRRPKAASAGNRPPAA